MLNDGMKYFWPKLIYAVTHIALELIYYLQLNQINK